MALTTFVSKSESRRTEPVDLLGIPSTSATFACNLRRIRNLVLYISTICELFCVLKSFDFDSSQEVHADAFRVKAPKRGRIFFTANRGNALKTGKCSKSRRSLASRSAPISTQTPAA